MVGEQEVGLCNTHLRFSSETPLRVHESGIDTWKLNRYFDSPADFDRAAAILGSRHHKVGNHFVGVLRSHWMLSIEGHPAVDGLASPAALGKAEDRVLGEISDLGVPLGRDAGVGRLDQTTTLEFANPLEGRAFLEGLARVDVPRTKPAVYGRPVETVYLLGQSSGKVLARVYDKGVQTNSAEPGRFVRLENQTRFTKQARIRAKVHSDVPEFVSEKFRRRFAPVAASCEGLHAATAPVVAERLGDLVSEGAVSYREAERMLGFLLLQGTPGAYRRTTVWRRRRELRAHGLVLVDPIEDPIDVDLAAGVEAALEAWSHA
jgi:hypothetical protein